MKRCGTTLLISFLLIMITLLTLSNLMPGLLPAYNLITATFFGCAGVTTIVIGCTSLYQLGKQK